MIVFRQKGYHAASMSDPGEAMHLSAGSIYKAFKDKRSLFLLVFERYLLLRKGEGVVVWHPVSAGGENNRAIAVPLHQ